jgi:hypothetical protein
VPDNLYFLDCWPRACVASEESKSSRFQKSDGFGNILVIDITQKILKLTELASPIVFKSYGALNATPVFGNLVF